MSIKTVFAQILAYFSGSHVGETLATLSKSAEADYDAALNRAHIAFAGAKAELGRVAVTELDRLEALIEAAKRRALLLEGAGVLPAEHDKRLDTVISKVV